MNKQQRKLERLILDLQDLKEESRETGDESKLSKAIEALKEVHLYEYD